MFVHGNTAAVVGNRNAVARKQRDMNMIGVAAHGFVQGVVKNFPDQMMEAVDARRADIHARAFAHRLQTLQYENIGSSIIILFYLAI